MDRFIPRESRWLLSLMLALLSGGLQAESAPEIEEVLVTAQKRVQSAQEVPVSMTLFSGESVKEQRLKTAADIQYQTPGLIVSYSSTNAIPNFVLRGVGLNDFTAIQSSPVAITWTMSFTEIPRF